MMKKIAPLLIFPCVSYASFYTTLAPIYWQANVNGLNIGILETGSTQKVIDLDFDYDFGFRVGLGATLKKNWDIELRYTHIHTNAYAETEGQIFPSFGARLPLTNGFVDKQRTHWRLHLGVVDLEAICPSAFCSESFILSPHFGLRYASVRQKFNVHYFGGSLFPEAEDLISSKNKYSGIGVTGGLNTEWMLFKNISLFFDNALSFLQGEFYVHQIEKATTDEQKRQGILNIFHSGASILDLAIGPKWENKNISLKAAWENHFFFCQNQFLFFTQSYAFAGNQGDLSLKGFTLTLDYRL